MDPGGEEAPNRAQTHGHEGLDPTAGTLLPLLTRKVAREIKSPRSVLSCGTLAPLPDRNRK